MAWVKVAKVSDVKAGMGHSVQVNGREIALFQVDGQFYCIENVCPHMDGPLSEGELHGDVVHCPWHYWPISVTSGRMTYDPAVCVDTFPCRIDGDNILIDVAE